MPRQRKTAQRRSQPPKYGPLNKPTRTYVVMRYEVRTPPGMTPEWVERETPPMDEAYAYQLYEGALAEMTGEGTQFAQGPPIRDPYLVRIEQFETPLTRRMEDARRWHDANEAANAQLRAELEAHLAAGGTVQASAGTLHFAAGEDDD